MSADFAGIPLRNAVVPRLSVVIPHFDHERFLGEAIDAIMGQSRRADEVILVDDGSRPESQRAVETIVAAHPGIRFIRHPVNRGVIAACRTGLQAVSGDYVLFSAADDRISSGLIERAHEALAIAPDTGLIFSDVAEMDETGENVKVMSLGLSDTIRHFSSEHLLLTLQRSLFHFSAGSVWYNAAALRALDGFDERLRWHADLYAAYAIGLTRGATYAPGVYSCFRKASQSYSERGRRSSAQVDVLGAWLAKSREPGAETVRHALRAAAVLPSYDLSAIKALRSDPDFVTSRLVWRIIVRNIWSPFRHMVPWRYRTMMRRLLSRRA
jgi:glycosyltransferase involved in cell wall biosynthesis